MLGGGGQGVRAKEDDGCGMSHQWSVDMLKDSWPECTVKHERFERVEVVGPVTERERVLHELREAGFWTTWSGPYTDAEMWPKIDSKRFKFVAERKR